MIELPKRRGYQLHAPYSPEAENSPEQSGVARGDTVGRHGGAGEFWHPALRMSVVRPDRGKLPERDEDRYEPEAAMSGERLGSSGLPKNRSARYAVSTVLPMPALPCSHKHRLPASRSRSSGEATTSPVWVASGTGT